MSTSSRLKISFLAVVIATVPLLVQALADDAIALQDGFETQKSRTITDPWQTEGSGAKGIDIGLGLASSGKNNAFIRTDSREWNAITRFVNVTPFATYRASAMVRTSGNVRDGYMGVRDELGEVIKEVKFGPLPNYTNVFVDFTTPRRTVVKFFIGYWAPAQDSWIQLDDVVVSRSIRLDGGAI